METKFFYDSVKKLKKGLFLGTVAKFLFMLHFWMYRSEPNLI